MERAARQGRMRRRQARGAASEEEEGAYHRFAATFVNPNHQPVEVDADEALRGSLLAGRRVNPEELLTYTLPEEYENQAGEVMIKLNEAMGCTNAIARNRRIVYQLLLVGDKTSKKSQASAKKVVDGTNELNGIYRKVVALGGVHPTPPKCFENLPALLPKMP